MTTETRELLLLEKAAGRACHHLSPLVTACHRGTFAWKKQPAEPTLIRGVPRSVSPRDTSFRNLPSKARPAPRLRSKSEAGSAASVQKRGRLRGFGPKRIKGLLQNYESVINYDKDVINYDKDVIHLSRSALQIRTNWSVVLLAERGVCGVQGQQCWPWPPAIAGASALLVQLRGQLCGDSVVQGLDGGCHLCVGRQSQGLPCSDVRCPGPPGCCP